MNKIGLVLSGGGARGFAHLGLLQALDELNIRPDAISGTSAGSIVGAFYAAGNKPKDILAFMRGNSYFKWSNFLLHKDGFFSMQPLSDMLKKYITHDSFETLSIKLFVTVTDFTKNKSLTYSKGPLFQSIIASSSVPVIFEPVSKDESLLVDGGILNNFPVEPLKKNCNKIIGSYVNKVEPMPGPAGRFGKTHILERCFNMASSIISYQKKSLCDIFIEPSLDKYTMFDNAQADIIYDIGYKAALEYQKEFRMLFKDH